MPNNSPNLDRVFQALADPTRWAIVGRLGRGPASVGELAKAHAMGLPAFLQHVQVLESSGLIRSQKLGRVRTCHIERETLSEAEHWIASQRVIWEARLDRLETYVATVKDEDNGQDS
jgi:DNA-binding transcriptional ArsR family regulator